MSEQRHGGAGGVFESWLQVVLTVAVTITIAVGIICAAGLWAIYRAQLDNRETGLRNRAVNCTVAKNLGMVLPSSCLEDRVAPYFDAGAPVERPQPSAALCAVAARLQVRASGCETP